MTTRDQERLIRQAMSRRRFIGVSGMAAGGMLLAACGGDAGSDTTAAGAVDTTAAASPDTTAAASPETTAAAGGSETTAAGGEAGMVPATDLSSIVVGYNNPNRVIGAWLYVAQSQGFFEEVGITEIEVNDADDPVAPLLQGSYDISLYDADVLYNAEHQGQAGMRMLGINQGGEPLIFGAVAGIESAEDLRGRPVGLGRAGLRNEGLAKFMLGELGLDWQTDVEAISLTGGSDDWVQAMLTGQIDATPMFIRHMPLVEEAGGTILYQEFLPTPASGMGMLQSHAEENPEFAAAFLYAGIRGQRFVLDPNNKDEVIRILSEDFGQDIPDNVLVNWDLELQQLSQDWGWIPDETDRLMAELEEIGQVVPDIPWRDYTDVSYLHTAQEALGLDLNPAADLSSGESNNGPIE